MSTPVVNPFASAIEAIIRLFIDNGASEDKAKNAAEPFVVLLESLSGIPLELVMKDIGDALATGPPTITKADRVPVSGSATPVQGVSPVGIVVPTPRPPIITLTPPTPPTPKTTVGMPEFTKVTPKRYVTETSAPVLDTEALTSSVLLQQQLHIIQTTVTGVASIISEFLSLGQIDAVLQDVHSMLALFDYGEVYAGVRALRLENTIFRPIQYLVNSQNPNMVPNPADLVRFRMREREDGTPILSQEEFERFMGWLGFGPFWTEAYWQTRFNNPSNMELLELWRRGEITKADVKKWMLLNEQHPAFIDKYLNVLERLPTRVEARLMSRRRPLTDAEINEILHAEGIKEAYYDDYEYMLRNWDIDSINGRIQSQVIGAFEDGFLSEAEFRNMLSTTMASEDEMTAMLQEATLRRLRRQAGERKTTVLKMYSKRIIPREEATEILAGVGFEEVDIDHWLDFTEAARGEIPVIELPVSPENESTEKQEAPKLKPLERKITGGEGS